MNENKKFINIAVLTAVAVVLNLMTIPLPFFASYLKIDISVVFLFIVGYRYGFKYATFSVVVVAIINSILKGSTPFFIGEITYAISFLIYFISYTAIKKTKLNNYISDILIVVFMTIIMVFLNYLIITPLYTIGYGGQWPDMRSIEYIVSIISLYTIFNICQWGINTVLVHTYLKFEKKEK